MKKDTSSVSPTQAWVLAGIVAALLGSSLALWLLAQMFAPRVPSLESAAARVAFALPWAVVTLMPLAMGIGVVAQARFFDPDTIDGSPPVPGTRLDLHRRVLSNTLEQSTLAVGAHIGLAAVMPPAWLAWIPSLAVWFLVARLAFWIGYLVQSRLRAFGFAATFYPTAAVIAIVLLRMWTGVP